MAKTMLWSGQGLDADTALELIESVIRLYRSEHPSEQGSDNALQSTDGGIVNLMDPGRQRRRRTDEPTDDGAAVAAERKQAPRTAYTLSVKGGAILQIENRTPATKKIIDFLKGKHDVTMDRLVDGTKLKPSTISNILVDLRKQGVLKSVPVQSQP